MAFFQFFEDFFHYGLTEQDSLGAHTELFTILTDGSHLAVIQIYDLTMAAHQRCLLFFEIFGIYALGYFPSAGHL